LALRRAGDPRLEKMQWCVVQEGEFLMGIAEEKAEVIPTGC
jgi:hypothetical protein